MHLQQGFVELNILPNFGFEKVFLTRTSKNTPKATSRLHWEKFLFALSPRIFFRFQFGSLHPGVIPVWIPASWSPKNQLQHAGIAPVHIFKTEGARIYFRFNDKSQWNPRISHHFGSKSTNSLSNPNFIAYSEPPWCPLPLTTLSLMQDMENEAAGIQKCVQFEHTGGRRWPLNCSSAAKS